MWGLQLQVCSLPLSARDFWSVLPGLQDALGCGCQKESGGAVGGTGESRSGQEPGAAGRLASADSCTGSAEMCPSARHADPTARQMVMLAEAGVPVPGGWGGGAWMGAGRGRSVSSRHQQKKKDKPGQGRSPGHNPGQLSSPLGASVSLFVTWRADPAVRGFHSQAVTLGQCHVCWSLNVFICQTRLIIAAAPGLTLKAVSVAGAPPARGLVGHSGGRGMQVERFITLWGENGGL